MSHCEVQIRITSTGEMEVLSEIPQVAFTLGGAANPLLLTVQAAADPGAAFSWDFGDGSEPQSGPAQQHSYAKPGRYTVNLRVVRSDRLSEFGAEVVVSRSHADRLIPPVTAFPDIKRGTVTNIPEVRTQMLCTTVAAADDPVITNWRVGILPRRCLTSTASVSLPIDASIWMAT